MDKIDKYLCNLFNNDKSAGVIELKEELKCHLLDMAHEFISQGHSKEEAYDMAIEQKTQHNKWIDESKRFEETFNKFVSSRDVNSTDQYKSELDKLLKSNEWNCVYRLYVYDDENIFSEPVYTYQVKGGTSNFETSGQTEKNGKGQVLYYRLKLKDIVSTKIVETVKIISIYTTLIFFVIFMILKRQYKKL